jgi:4-hydroxy-3-methylbut-2-enyl diphosphate reductase
VGDPSSNNTAKLADIGKEAGISQVLRINDVHELNPEDLYHVHTIALTSGASTPTYLTDQVIEYLETGMKTETRIQDIL